MHTLTSSSLFFRKFVAEGSPYAAIEWEERTAEVGSFRQENVEFPTFWSQDATNIVAQKYFRGAGSERERSLRQIVERVTMRLTTWAESESKLTRAECHTLIDELAALVLHQRLSFNSPVWFNLGVPATPQQGSACFILNVEDDMRSILNWYTEEGIIFQRGSGAGVNLSKLRGSNELLNGGGTASGPVSFMRGADASAGTIKSGGKTRRAAKMVLLDDDHPDVLEFVQAKAHEERKARALTAAGFDVGVDGADLHSLSYQNANNSVRLSDEFMRVYENDDEWVLEPRGSDDPLSVTSVAARELMHEIAEAAWACGDPGVQFSTTINSWHTLSQHSPINASNPCSEYLSIDNSACNLASLNLLNFLDGDEFDVDGFRHAVRVTVVAMDALAGRADYPTETIGENARRYRQLGLGYTNLGALLMRLGLPYDSQDGRQLAGAITSLMTAEAYLTSGELAGRVGPFHDWELHAPATMNVLNRHRQETQRLSAELRSRNGEAYPAAQTIASVAVKVWDEAIDVAVECGVRNSQVTLLAPTGTISFMMDAETTGVEPEFSLVKTKTLVGGGTITTVNAGVRSALERLGYDPDVVNQALAILKRDGNLQHAPISDRDLPIFATAVGENAISPSGHLLMLAAVQPFLSGGISKTVNVPANATVDDIETLIVMAWKLGIKSIAVYRDGCKAAQPLETAFYDMMAQPLTAEQVANCDGNEHFIVNLPKPVRVKLPKERPARTFSFRVADCKGYVTVGEYEDGSPGEVFLRVAKQGSTLEGILDSLAVTVSLGLQHGVPLEAFCQLLIGTKFEPHGLTGDDLRTATSLVDYVFHRLAVTYLDDAALERLGLQTVTITATLEVPTPIRTTHTQSWGGLCTSCGASLVRTGSCMSCPACGETSGCG